MMLKDKFAHIRMQTIVYLKSFQLLELDSSEILMIKGRMNSYKNTLERLREFIYVVEDEMTFHVNDLKWTKQVPLMLFVHMLTTLLELERKRWNKIINNFIDV